MGRRFPEFAQEASLRNMLIALRAQSNDMAAKIARGLMKSGVQSLKSTTVVYQALVEDAIDRKDLKHLALWMQSLVRNRDWNHSSAGPRSSHSSRSP